MTSCATELSASPSVSPDVGQPRPSRPSSQTRPRASSEGRHHMPGNSITLVGNVTRDPELRFTPSGQATTSFGLAVNRRWQNRQTQEWEEQVSFFDVVCWREMAENAAESLTKGTRIVVTGRLEQRSWDDKT